MPTRMQLLFDVTTDPTNKTAASSHSGGWSEGFWFSTPLSNAPTLAGLLGALRSVLLGQEITIVGWRVENFTFSGNRLIPGGASSGVLNLPGAALPIASPQICLSCNGQASGVPNNNRFTLRGIPNAVVANGEYQPLPSYSTALTNYFAALTVGSIGFVGRNKAGSNARVMSVTAGGVVTLNSAIGGVPGTDFLRLNRVYADNGLPIKGSYLITNIAGGTQYTLAGLIPPGPRTTPSGTARVDSIQFFSYGSIVPGRLGVKKIGRPFQGYRGRRSHARA
jgi:hypothetical protein